MVKYYVQTGAVPQFWKWGTNYASEANRNFFDPHFWSVGDKILLR